MNAIRASTQVVLLIVVLSLQGLADTSPAAPPNRLADEERATGFELLFDGKSLEGWNRHEGLPGQEDQGGQWVAEHGSIIGRQDPSGGGGFLTTLKKYRDFELKLETKIEWPFDSGIFLRVGPHGKSHQVTLDYHEHGQVGGIYCPWTHGFVCPSPDGKKSFKKDAWNQVMIRIEGEPARIRFWLNGKIITDFQHHKETTEGIPEEGTICLQVHAGGEGREKSFAAFRNIRVRVLER